MNSKIERIYVVDALRGFAIVAIMLLHNLEHFDVYFLPPELPEWIKSLDKIVWETTFYLFASKSYTIFAFLFGLTYFIQTSNQQKRGKDFRLRFAWRLAILFLFGIFNSFFFQGDILSIYAIIGFFLIPVTNWSNKALLILSVVLLIQPLEIYHLIQAIQNPNQTIANPESWTYFGKMSEYIHSESFIDIAKGNLTNGKRAVLMWNYENGRFFQILALFILGFLSGKNKIFIWTESTKQFWKKTIIISAIAYTIFYFGNIQLEAIINSEAVKRPLLLTINSWANLSFTFVIISAFVLLYQSTSIGHKILNPLSYLGKMTLSNYVFQSMLGVLIYYEFGLGLYKVTGATYALLIGIALSIFTWFLCYKWSQYNKRGPLEEIWHKLTWLKSKK